MNKHQKLLLILFVAAESNNQHVKTLQDKLSQDIPPMLHNVVGKTCTFEVKVTTHNQDGRVGYTVARLAEVAASAPTIKEADHIEEAAPSKKAKIN